MPTIAELQTRRAAKLEVMQKVVEATNPNAAQIRDYDDAQDDIKKIDEQIDRARDHQTLMAKSARPIGTGMTSTGEGYWAQPRTDAYDKDVSLALGGMMRVIAGAKGNAGDAVEKSTVQYGERHPVTLGLVQAKALSTVSGTSGGFAVPPDFLEAMIPLLYARAVVRRAGAIVMPMPNGTMTIPKMLSGTTANWIGETRPIPESAPQFGQVAATARKLAALVPVSNDMMRYASPSFDAQIRNDLISQIALAEDAAFIRGVGTQFSPTGMKTYATALGTQLVNSTSAYTLLTVSQELGAMVNKLEMANLPLLNVAWLMSPRTKNYLLNVQNSNGFYVYKEEMTQSKTLLGYPYYTTTQIPVNLSVGPNADCSEIYLVDFSETMILEGRQMEFAISTEASYVDTTGTMRNAFQDDLTVIRGLIAEDFQLRHDEAVALNQGVRWAPAAAA